MNKETYQTIIDAAYSDYTDNFIGYEDVPPKEWFIEESKTNKPFSERFGLKYEILNKDSKHIRVTYKNKIIEFYE